MVSAHITTGSKPYIVEDRPMISRSSGDRGKIMQCTFTMLLSTYWCVVLTFFYVVIDRKTEYKQKPIRLKSK